MTVEKDWSFERVKAEQERAEANGADLGDPTTPLYQWMALHHLDAFEERYRDGDAFALMLALRMCANHDLVMPKWVWSGYIRAFDKVLNLRVKSWDEAFGAPLPKGARLQDRRRHRELGPAVWLEVRQLLNSLSPPAIDEALFEQVGQKFGIKKTLAQEIYYEWQRRNA